MPDAILVKLCGLRSEHDVRAAVAAGADQLGIVLVPGVRRSVAPAQAARLVQVARAAATENQRADDAAPLLVGVVGGMSVADAVAAVHAADVDVAQLVGDDAWAREVAAQLAPLPLVRVIPVPLDLTVDDDRLTGIEQQTAAWEADGARTVFDATVGGQLGGTGEALDPRRVRHLFATGGRGLAGGLDPTTVTRAIRELGPALVDVSSGIERGGTKDATLMREFVAAARAAHLDHAPEQYA